MQEALLDQYRDFAKVEFEKHNANKDRRKRSPCSLITSPSQLNFHYCPELEKKWMSTYYPGAFLDPKASSLVAFLHFEWAFIQGLGF